MASPGQNAPKAPTGDFSRTVEAKAALKLRAQRSALRNPWLGLGVTGVIGWSISLPVVIGALIGASMDRRYPGGRSWTLMLLVAGLCIGCFQAASWVAREDRALRSESEADNG